MRILKQENVYGNKFLNIFTTLYQKRDGTEANWYHVDRVNNPRIVMIVPTFVDDVNNERVIMIKEFRVPLNDYEYGFPTGLVDEGETIESAIARELKEETGLDVVEIAAISPTIYNSAGLTSESVQIAFVKVSGVISTLGNESSEEIEVLNLSIAELNELFNNPYVKFGAKTWLVMLIILMKM